jgi:hypothetical protein
VSKSAAGKALQPTYSVLPTMQRNQARGEMIPRMRRLPSREREGRGDPGRNQPEEAEEQVDDEADDDVHLSDPTSEVEVGPPARNSRRPKWEFTSGSPAMNTQKDSVPEPKGSPP